MKKLIITLSMIFSILFSNTIINSNITFAAVSKTGTTKHSIQETITLVTNSIYNPLTNQYINYCKDENGEVYTFYSDQSLFNKWEVLIIDTKENTNIKDDEVTNSFDLNDYTFNDANN